MTGKNLLFYAAGNGLGARAISLLLGIISLWLIIGGAWLVAIGGSSYYLFAGSGCIISAFLYATNRRGAMLAYLVVFAATCLWAYAKVGGEFWRLMPRIGAPFAVAVLLLLHGLFSQPKTRRIAVIATTAALFCAASAILALRHIAEPVAAPDRTVIAVQDVARDWPAFGGSEGGSRYAPSAQITSANVGKLERAWTYRTGDIVGPQPGTGFRAFEVTPIKIGDLLYVCTPHNIVIAIDADSGRERWRFDPHVNTEGARLLVCRGVAHFQAPAGTKVCPSRILMATLDARMIALDALTGRPCKDFGSNGEISLLHQMGQTSRGLYYVTSPPAIVSGTAVVGGWVYDGESINEPAGVIRGFDAATGKLRWAWDPGAIDENSLPKGGSTYTLGSPNSWGAASVDAQLGMVYVPMGNATPDYVGMHRSAANERYSSAVVALDGKTGKRRWSFQTAHHDLWDYDIGSQPVLFDMPMPGGGTVPALAQPTKHGDIYILDRRTGRPLTDVVEQAVPKGSTPGERYSPTQPYSTGFPTLSPPALKEEDMWGATPLDQLWCRIRYRSVDYRGKFTPPSMRGTLQYPGNFGVVDWGSVSVDALRGLMLVNSSNMPLIVTLYPRAQADKMGDPNLGQHAGYAPQRGTPYSASAAQFVSPLNIPCNAPPWGRLTAIDLKTRKISWQRPLGTSRDHAPLGIAVPGIFNLGGAVATAGGVTFLGATVDRYFRAFDSSTGQELWRDRLPAAAQAGAMSYVSGRTGRQYVLIAAGGHGMLQSGSSDHIIAYALPKATPVGRGSEK
jgi:quinoprotein glucose dehydrogenase